MTKDGELYPKVAASKDEIKIYEGPQRPILSLKFLKPTFYLSPMGNYIGVCEVISSAPKGGKGRKRFSLYNVRGEKSFEMEWETEYDSWGKSFYLSDFDGSILEIDNGSPIVILRDKQGTEIAKLDIFGYTGPPPFPYTTYFEFSQDGNYFGVVGNERWGDPSNPNCNPQVVLFDKQGKELWRKALDEYHSSFLSLSATAKYILVGGCGPVFQSSRGRVYLFNRNGEIIRKYNYLSESDRRADIDCSFSNDEEVVAIASNECLLLIKSETGEVISKWNLPSSGSWKKPRTIDMVQISSNGETIFVAASEKDPMEALGGIDPDLFLISSSGALIWHQQIPSSGNYYGYEVAITPDGKEIAAFVSGDLIRWRKSE